MVIFSVVEIMIYFHIFILVYWKIIQNLHKQKFEVFYLLF
jgi:hypothetical protein